MDPPPPPPPHGNNDRQKKSGLPDGNYDIFVIPPHSAGSGFLYLPSLQTHRNSFLAGVASTLAAIMIWTIVLPVVKEWFTTLLAGGGPGVLMLLLAVGVGCWAFGKTQGEGAVGGEPGGASGGAGASTASGPPPTGTHGTHGAHGTGSTQPPPRPSSTWSRPNAQSTGASSGAAGAAKNSWEKAREETRKKEEERRKAEELKKRREELEKMKQEQRQKETREREARERKERLEKLEKEREAAAAAAAAKKDIPKTPSPKKPPFPTARTETEDDAYSFRPYDRPKESIPKARSAASMYSESSYAPSQTTARTTPPPSHRGPYTTKDQDKIIIKAVYSFNNAFIRTPIAKLISGQGHVTDGLILRITTEGLFIDDDIRGVPQREWDVKAWTLKLAEVCCPQCAERSSGSNSKPRNFSSFFYRSDRFPSEEESTAFLKNLVTTCKTDCAGLDGSLPASAPLSASSSASPRVRINKSFPSSQHAEMRNLHILRAHIRDQEGKKYVFVLDQSEGWKVAVGLQRLRRGTQVRALAVNGMPMNEAKAMIENLGWA